LYPGQLQNWASPGFFYTANSHADITAALNAMFNHALVTAISPIEAARCLEKATIGNEFEALRRSRRSTAREKYHETILRKPCHCRGCNSRRLGFAGAGACGAADRDTVAGI
jgi:hypothetical protein